LDLDVEFVLIVDVAVVSALSVVLPVDMISVEETLMLQDFSIV